MPFAIKYVTQLSPKVLSEGSHGVKSSAAFLQVCHLKQPIDAGEHDAVNKLFNTSGENPDRANFYCSRKSCADVS